MPHKDPIVRRKFAREYMKKWSKSNRESLRLSAAKKRANNPFGIKAYRLVHIAVKNGVLKKPSKCSACKKTKKVFGHHEDYRKPLEVIWLCTSCHEAVHHLEAA